MHAPTADESRVASIARSPWQIPVLLGVVVALAHVAFRMTGLFPVGVFSDDGVYVALGKALAQGDGYRSIYAVGSPPHYKYPPLLPALLALLWKLSPAVDDVQRLWGVITPILTGTSAGLLAWIGRRLLDLPWGTAVVLGAAVLLTDPALHYLNLPIAEAPYILLWCLFTIALSSALASERSSPWWAVVVLSALAPFLRAQGLVLVLAAAGVLWARRSFAWGASTALLAGTPFLVWSGIRRLSASAIIQPDELPYTAWFMATGLVDGVGGVLANTLTNARAYFWILAENGAPWPALGAALAVSLIALTLAGAVRCLRDRPEVVVPVSLTALLVLLWPWPQDRLLLPLLPFAGLLAGRTLTDFGKSRWAGTLLTLLVVSIGARQFVVRGYAYSDYDPGEHQRVAYPSLFLTTNALFLWTATGWLSENALPTDRVVTPLHAGVHLYTGLQTVTASPAEPLAGPSVFDVPGAYLASRILGEGASLAALGDARSPLAHDVRALSQACPHVVETAGSRQNPAPIVFYRLILDRSCLEPIAKGVGSDGPPEDGP